MKGQRSMKAEYGPAWAIVDGSMGDRRRKKNLEREAMGKGDLPLSLAAGEETATAICGDTAGLACASAPHLQETGKGMLSFTSVLLNSGARIAFSDLPPCVLHRLVLLHAKPSEQELYHEGSWKLRPVPGSLMSSVIEAL